MPQNIADTLLAYGGITSADFPQILGANPFHADPSGRSAPDPDHYECVEQLSYVPGQPNIESFGISNAYTSSATNTTSHQYSVRLAIAGTWLYQSLKGSDTWTWSHSSSATNTSTSQSTEQVSLHQPTAGYTGSTLVFVYVDKVYKTILFSFVPPSVPTARCQ